MKKLKNLQVLIYNLIYPAILGSMIYDLFNIKWDRFFVYYLPHIFTDARYLFSISIVLFYLIDYYHLYAFMENEYTKAQKSKISYIVFDFLVSILLLLSFKIYRYSPNLSIIFVTIVPFCFLIYNIQLKRNRTKWQPKTLLFYSLYSGFFILGVFLIILFTNSSFLLMSYYVLLMVIVYGSYVLRMKNSDDRPTEIFIAMGNQYKATTLGKFEEIFDKY